MNGRGTYTSPDGSKYVGEFRDNWANGKGTLNISRRPEAGRETARGFRMRITDRRHLTV
jgi:hypothetical protein